MKEHGAVHSAIVVDNVDPANGGRVKVWLPQVLVAGEGAHEAWARIATLMAGTNRGTWFIPDVGDEVVVAFEQGNLDRPYVLGSLWNSANPPPGTMAVDNNNKKFVRSRNGVQITLRRSRRPRGASSSRRLAARSSRSRIVPAPSCSPTAMAIRWSSGRTESP